MDPTHRMLLEATYEGFENGTSLRLPGSRCGLVLTVINSRIELREGIGISNFMLHRHLHSRLPQPASS
jgi:hypothetical protein